MSAAQEPEVSITQADALNVGRQVARSTLAFGAALLGLGVLAIMAPLLSGFAVTVFVGMLLIAGGVLETLFAFKAPSFGRGALTFLFGGLGIAAGVLLLGWPADGLGALTIMLAAYFVSAGVVDVILALKLRPAEGWSWALFSGLLAVGLGILIMAGWPVSGIVAVGMYVGVRLLMHGCVLMALGVSSRDLLEYGQNARLETLEGHVRDGMVALAEAQVFLVAQTAALIALDKEVRQKVSATSVDPAIRELNIQLGDARVAMKAAAEASGEAWDAAQKEANRSFDALRKKATTAAEHLQRDLGVEGA
jgi:uncharacterized membrane protein HdeD (DUF308 family)